ncbi:hypothetical protein G6514_009853 [Epicoccum nigrum]|nr:hypothetical protein G6514_009853 [Epicoccum nigrum]
MHENPDKAEARRQARRLIENIAQNHTLNGTVFGTPLESLLNNCLEILSKQLYEKNTHFLLELIQNADDNSYNCATPTLSFIYKSGNLRIDCNEVGFDASNVTAICGISQSTKSNKTRDGEFIGEKGIGFKSVFKVADTVRIASNEFTFKFDRTKPLGMITPLWEEHPEQSKRQGTSINLQLSTSYNEQTLIEELFEFDTNLLVFLRRIQEINIEVECADSTPWKKQIRKIQYEQDCDQIVQLKTGEKSVNFVTKTHVVRSLPREARRKDWTETNVLFAFPLPSANEGPTLETRNVYAFLPIRSYGFRFLIQADFILTASREDIESTLPWNVSIRDALSDAFLSSILHFNKSDMKYVWPFYLPSISNAISGFFEPAIASILSRVKESPVFESFVGNMVLPTSLAHVPADFCADGEPFTLCKTTQDRYLSSRYAIWVMEAMKSVGVQQLTARQFLEDLATMLATDAGYFQQKSSQWHTKLAATLLRLSTDADLMSLVQNLAIIPLNDGTWVAARDSNIFFSKSEDSLEIPDGISISILDSDVEADLNRRMLFISLGVKEWSAAEICRLIMDLHQSADFQPHRLSTAEIVSHAIFVYQAEWQPPKSANLWFATTRSERARGRDTYVPGIFSADSAAARVFAVDHPAISRQKPYSDSPVRKQQDSKQLISESSPPARQSEIDEELNVSENIVYRPTTILDYGIKDKFQLLATPTSVMTGAYDLIQSDTGISEGTSTKSVLLQPDATNESAESTVFAQEPFTVVQNVLTKAPVPDYPTAQSPEVQSTSSEVAEQDDEPGELLFELSEEFKCMFCECESSDVLQLFKDNWHHYSQWVEGPHMDWQSRSFKFASAELRTKISESLVRTLRGHLPLQETVLATLDTQLDISNALPALDIHKPEDPEWNLLTYFGVSVKSDVPYYLRCITTLSADENPDVDMIVYIYEQLQSRYTGNEALIRAAFYSKEIILITSGDDLMVNGPTWINMANCTSQGIDLTSIYVGCSFLFRCLYTPSGDPIGGLVHAITMITSSSKLENITRLFRELNKSLQDINSSKIALLLKPLHDKPIFPVVDEAKDAGYDRLLSLHNKSWFIADSADLMESFTGIVPLLAFPAQDLPMVENVLQALRVDGRVISKRSTNHTRVIGQTKSGFHLANSFSRKIPFLKALVPRNHPSESVLKRQISQLRVRIATSIVRTFKLTVPFDVIVGNEIPGNVCVIPAENTMTLVMTDEAAKAACPTQELVSALAQMCGIKEQRHIMLLFIVLSSLRLKSINAEFLQHGLEVEGLLLEDDSEDYLDYEEGPCYSTGGIDEASTPLSNEETNSNPHTNPTLSEGFKFGAQGHEKDEVDLDSDRRIPMVPRIKGAGNTYLNVRLSELERKEDEFVENDHVQFLGENMVCEL